MTKVQYRAQGEFACVTVQKAFGSWNLALESAGLLVNHRKSIPDEEFFSNIADVWTAIGRQPTSKDISDRTIGSVHPKRSYQRRFGTWNHALLAFSEYISFGNSKSERDANHSEGEFVQPKKRTSRDVGWRLRASILIRDNCICKMCGDSPAKNPATVLHVDHILAWANGGETVEENLQTLCAKCNIGKSDAIF